MYVFNIRNRTSGFALPFKCLSDSLPESTLGLLPITDNSKPCNTKQNSLWVGNKPLKIPHLATCTYTFSKLYSEFSFFPSGPVLIRWKQYWHQGNIGAVGFYYSFLYVRFSTRYFFGHLTDFPHLSRQWKNAFERKGGFLFRKSVWM